MNVNRSWLVAFATVFALLGGVLAMLAWSSRRGETTRVGTNALTSLADAIDRLDEFRGDALAKGTFRNVLFREGRLFLGDEQKDRFPRTGRWTSEEIVAEFPFTELLPSWNPNCPTDTGLTLHVRVRDARDRRWSPWLYLGQWGRTQHDPTRTVEYHDGKVEIDVLVLDRPADAYQVRVGFESYNFDPAVSPALRKLSVVYSGRDTRGRSRPPTTLPANWARDLPVPFFAQGDSHPAVKSEICSPTSLAMVLAYRGVRVDVLQNALAVYDREYDLFGNWGRAVARAGELGCDATLVRIRSMDEARRLIAAGQPIIASIRFKKGEFPSHVMSETDGHLIVIRGFTPGGDAIVNDPASKQRGNGVVYRADELARAWFGAGGVAYLVGELDPASRLSR